MNILMNDKVSRHKKICDGLNQLYARKNHDYGDSFHHALEIDALVLWVLHEQLGWGEKRLRRFYDNFADEIDALVQRYQMDEEDKVWLCTQKLKDYGIDIEQWDKERSHA